MMEYIKKIIQADPKRMSKIFDEIMEKNQHYWKRFDGPDEIFKWLRNFSNEDEIYLALVLANNILYYNLDEVRSLWRIILTNRVKLFLLDEIFRDMELPDIEKWFPEYLREKCIFVGYGKAGKSGQSMVYPFQQSHNVKNLKYMELFEFLHTSEDFSKKEGVFLLDDFVGSGNQAKTTWYNKINDKSFNDVSEDNPHLKFIYLALIGFKDGKKVIEENTPMKVILGEELDERFKCFSDVSVIYENPNERIEAKRVMEEKGRMLYEYPLGYDNMELAVAFHHNTPNNSLPVIWKRRDDGSWYPLFERFE
jgi:hypothetical protein